MRSSGGPVLLLPPSEGKAPGGTGHWRATDGAFGDLAAARRRVISAYAAALDAPDITKVVGARGELAERARAAGRLLRRGRAPALPASERFTGIVWEHLDPASLDAEARGRIAVVSALCGLVAGDDPVPDHRLKLSVALPDTGRLDRWWRPQLTGPLERWAAGRPVWDLLPAEHAAAVDLDALDVTRVRFVDADRRAVGHDAKAVKGAFARHLLVQGPARVGRFAHGGWRATRDGADVVLVR